MREMYKAMAGVAAVAMPTRLPAMARTILTDG